MSQYTPTKYQRRKARRLKALRQLIASEAIDPAWAKDFLKGNKCYGRVKPSLAPITMRVVDWDVRNER